MDSTALILLLLKVVAVIALVLMNGLFVATEFALVKIRDTQLQPFIARGDRRAKLLRHIIAHLDAHLSAAQLGITLASLALGWIGEPIFEALLQPVYHWLAITSPRLQHSISFAVGFTVITFLHIVAGEQAPKSFGIRNPLPTALWIAYPLQWFYTLAYPFIWLLNESSLALLRLFGIQPADESASHSEDELRLMLATGQMNAGATALGRDIVLNALDLRHRIAREVMRPRREIVALDTHATITECLNIAESTRYSRFPLCENGDLNQTLGVVHIKDLFAHRNLARTGADLARVARKIIYIPETARLEKVLQLLQERQLHFAIVVDEYGDTLGLVTLENVLEEIVGQIQDEFDQEKPLLSQTGPTTWHLDGALPLHELSELVGESLAQEGVTTTSGLVTVRLGGFPKQGDLVTLGDFTLRVEEMAGPRVARLHLEKRPAPAPPPAAS